MGRVEAHITDEVNVKDSGDAVIDPRKENGHGSVVTDPSFARPVGAQPDGDLEAAKASGEALRIDSALAADETVTSAWVDTDGWQSLEIVVVADQPSADEGLKVEYTADANAETPVVDLTRSFSFDQDTVDEGGLTLVLPTNLDGFRITYENGATGQNTFLLVATLRTGSQAPQNTLISKVTSQSPALMNRGPILARDDADAWDDVRRSDSDGLRTSIVEHETDTPIRPLTKWGTGQTNVADTTPVQLAPSPLADRSTISVTNGSDTLQVYAGPTNAVSQTNGDIIPPLTTREWDLDESAEIFAIAETPDSPVSTNTQTISPAAGSTTGDADNPDNVVSSDDNDAVFDAQNEFVDASGYDATAVKTLDDIQTVKIGFEGANIAQTGKKTIGIEETVQKTQLNGTSITTTGSLQSVQGDYYIAYIAVRNQAESVASVSGLGLTWTQVGTITNANGVKIEVWHATSGMPSSGGQVTANFDSAVTSAAIVAQRLSSVNLTSPHRSTNSTTGATAGWSTTPATSQTGDRIVGLSAITLATSNDPTSGGADATPETEHADVNISGENEAVTLAVQSLESDGTSGTETSDGDWASAGEWASFSLAIKPEALDDPVIELTYEVGSEGEGATKLTKTLDSSTDGSFTVDVTGDRAWTFADIDNITVTATYTKADTLDAAVDHIFVEFTEASSGGLARVSWSEIGGDGV